MDRTIRLRAAHPPIWRTEHDLQFGPDAVVTLRDPAPWEQKLIAALERGIPGTALRRIAREYGVTEHDVRGLLDRLRPAMTAEKQHADGRTILVLAPPALPGVTALLAGMRAAGLTLANGHEPTPSRTPHALVTHHCTDPAAAREAMAADVPHIPIVLREDIAEVGPVVVPGRTPCLTCVDATRTVRDRAWPALRAQLSARSPGPVIDALTHQAGFVAAELVSDPDHAAARSVTITNGATRRRWRSHAFSPACACRSL